MERDEGRDVVHGQAKGPGPMPLWEEEEAAEEGKVPAPGSQGNLMPEPNVLAPEEGPTK